jgi:hypothetical protein
MPERLEVKRLAKEMMWKDRARGQSRVWYLLSLRFEESTVMNEERLKKHCMSLHITKK